MYVFLLVKESHTLYIHTLDLNIDIEAIKKRLDIFYVKNCLFDGFNWLP